ncbi:MAG: AI-2E family transporter, partial [Lachnospiraceae bacterium]|nr:AI-2E family transporter [Lachnospiraceae bacterium]
MSETKKLLFISGITLAVYLAIKYILPYVIPFFIAYMIVRLFNPVTEKICKWLVWKKEAVISILLMIFLAFCFLAIYFFYGLLTQQIRRIAMNMDYYYNSACGFIDHCCLMVEDGFGVEVEAVKEMVYSGIETVSEEIRVYIVPEV